MSIPMECIPRLPLLARDYFYDFDKVREFYDGDFRDPAAFRRQAERVCSRSLPREELAAVLSEQNRSYGCGPRTLDRIEKIVRDQACAVVTGQQVGLFSGPLYTIYKALTAIKLSEYLTRLDLGSFVPIFWMASDDHDSAEIDHLTLLDKNNRLEEVRCPMPSGDSKTPVSNILLTPDIDLSIGRLRELTIDSEFKTDVFDGLSEAYRPGRSWVEAFARWMMRLFKSHGLVLIDAGHPRLKEMGREVFYQEIAEESPSTARAVAASANLRRAGYGEQLQLHEGILNIFYAEGERRSIRFEQGVFRIEETERTLGKEDLLALAKEKPLLFSPNVLLRPVYQDVLLPTVAYVGGPAEIAYFAQMKGVYESFRLPMPVIYPRKSLTVVEKAVGRVLDKYHIDIAEVWRNADGVIRDAAKKQIPDSMNNVLSLAFLHVEKDFESMKREIAAIEPTLANAADLARGKMTRQLKFLENKILQAAKKRNDVAIRQLRKAVDSLYPNRRLQERVFNIVPFLVKYGDAFMEKLDQAVVVGESDHGIVAL